jgi:hypothetical protein
MLVFFTINNHYFFQKVEFFLQFCWNAWTNFFLLPPPKPIMPGRHCNCKTNWILTTDTEQPIMQSSVKHKFCKFLHKYAEGYSHVQPSMFPSNAMYTLLTPPCSHTYLGVLVWGKELLGLAVRERDTVVEHWSEGGFGTSLWLDRDLRVLVARCTAVYCTIWTAGVSLLRLLL